MLQWVAELGWPEEGWAGLRWLVSWSVHMRLAMHKAVLDGPAA